MRRILVSDQQMMCLSLACQGGILHCSGLYLPFHSLQAGTSIDVVFSTPCTVGCHSAATLDSAQALSETSPNVVRSANHA
jgi:hypothetical protein